MAKCRVCGITGNQRKITKHHLVSRSRMKQLCRDLNRIIPGLTIRLCETCHKGFHDNQIKLRKQIRRHIRDNLTSDEKMYIIQTAGLQYYVKKYTKCL